jgi:NTP pyrophosphatase (non-canonical NTP hydrolase)
MVIFMKSISEIQKAVGEWADRNFPSEESRGRLRCALGVCEEAGELAHAVLKRDQGIRGAAEKHEAMMRDAVGDVVVYLMDFCCREGWDFESIVRETANEVIKRDWTKDPDMGVCATPAVQDGE